MKQLRQGYTTGACAAAAAKGAAQMLREQRPVDEVEIVLPRGETARFRLRGQAFDEQSASCHVVKDAGDDPDVTNGAEIHVTVRGERIRRPGGTTMVFVRGGVGVGRVTKPGLAVSVGEPAINPVPLRMITEAVKGVYALVCIPHVLYVTVSIPNGEELSRKTLNARLGIVGGLSILGTTGIVRPISAQAWTDTIDAALNVARACGCRTVVLSTGRTSEIVAERHLGQPESGNPLKEECLVMMGDHVGYALRACSTKGVARVVVAGQFAKLLKIACGHEQTHVSSSQLDLGTLAQWLSAEPSTMALAGIARSANTARQVLDESGNSPDLIRLVCERAALAARHLAPETGTKVLLAGYGGEVLYFG